MVVSKKNLNVTIYGHAGAGGVGARTGAEIMRERKVKTKPKLHTVVHNFGSA